MELAMFSEVSVSMYELIQHRIPEVLKLRHHWYENFKFCWLEAHDRESLDVCRGAVELIRTQFSV
jgi:hypothetical protein